MYVVSPVYGQHHYGQNDTLYKIPALNKLRAVQKAAAQTDNPPAGDQATQLQRKQQEKKDNPIGRFRDSSFFSGYVQPQVLLSQEQTPFNKRYESMLRAYKCYGSLQQ